MIDPDTRYRPLDSDPYPWPYDGAIDPRHTALVLIDWQTDFCGPGGYVDAMGYDLNLTRSGLAPTKCVLDAARERGFTIVHTREGHRPDLSDCPPAKRLRGSPTQRIGEPGPMGRLLIRGEPGTSIIPALAPKRATGSAVSTNQTPRTSHPNQGLPAGSGVANIAAMPYPMNQSIVSAPSRRPKPATEPTPVGGRPSRSPG